VTVPVEQISEIRVANRLKGILEEIASSIDNASHEQKEQLLVVLEDWHYGHKRGHPRKTCSLNVDYAAGDRAFKGEIKNVSVNGLFIETSEQFSPGQKITLTFSLPNHTKPLKTTGEVVWNGTKGVGVQFNLPNKYLEEFWKAKIETL
jgi:Tfp pilus assembly protein PilZ